MNGLAAAGAAAAIFCVRRRQRRIIIRRVTILDSKEVLGPISEGLYGGNDYIPAVFNQWVAQPNRELFGSFDGPTLVAFEALSSFDGGESYMCQALRVLPSRQGQSLARQLSVQVKQHACARAKSDSSGEGLGCACAATCGMTRGDVVPPCNSATAATVVSIARCLFESDTAGGIPPVPVPVLALVFRHIPLGPAATCGVLFTRMLGRDAGARCSVGNLD